VSAGTTETEVHDPARRSPPCAAHVRAPATTTCRGCGLFLCGECAAGAAEPRCPRCRSAGHPVPWEDPTLGSATAFWRTLRALTGVTTFFSQLPWTGGLRAPLSFAAVATTIGALGAGLMIALQAGVMGSLLGTTRETFMGAAPDAAARELVQLMFNTTAMLQQLVLRYTLFEIVTAPLLAPLQLLIMGALTHGVARLLGGRGTFEATVRAMSYAAGAQVLRVVPFMGNPLAALAGLLLVAVALRRAHGVSPARAAVLTLWWLPVMAAFLCLFTGLVVSRVAPILLGR
jgi:hypothetical protein